MKTVKPVSTLYYYDGPQVLEARDGIGGHYIAVIVEQLQDYDRYLVAGVAPNRLRQFRSGILDLRTLLVDADADEWYLASAPAGPEQLMTLEPQPRSLTESGLLPDEGFVLHDRPADELALNEARMRNNVVIEITADPPEAVGEHRIRVGTFTGLLNHVQTVVRHAYTAALRETSAGTRSRLHTDDAHLLDVVVPAAAGSFRVVLEGSQTPGLFGIAELTRALRRVDSIFEHADSPEQTLITLKEQRGHLAGSYLRLLNFLIERKTGLQYSWAEPISVKANYGSVSESEANSLVEILSGVSNLGSEPVTLVGEFERGNRGIGSWGLLTEDGIYSGKIKEGGPSLNGLKFGGHYKFVCVEEIEEIEATGRESRTLYLNAYEPV